MKLHLIIDSDKTIPGFITVNPMADPANPNQVAGDITNLNHICDDGEAEEILAEEILEYYPLNVVDSIVTHWMKKLAHGGKLRLIGLDAYAIAQGLITGKLTLEGYNQYVFSHQMKDWQFRKNLLSLERFTDVARSRGFKINVLQLNGYQFELEVERP